MEPTKIRRPPSVWISQVILLAVGMLWLGTSIFFAYIFVSTNGGSVLSLLTLFVLIAFSMTALTGFWGLARRKRYGRVVGVLFLSFITLGSLLGNFARPKGPVEYYTYKNYAELLGGITAGVVFYGLMIFLIYRLANGERANTFFSQNDSVVKNGLSQPPPPPNFNEAE